MDWVLHFPLCHTSSPLMMCLCLPFPLTAGSCSTHPLRPVGVPSKPSWTVPPSPGWSLVSFAKHWVLLLCVPVDCIPTEPPEVRLLQQYFGSQLCIPALGSEMGKGMAPGWRNGMSVALYDHASSLNGVGKYFGSVRIASSAFKSRHCTY